MAIMKKPSNELPKEFVSQAMETLSSETQETEKNEEKPEAEKPQYAPPARPVPQRPSALLKQPMGERLKGRLAVYFASGMANAGNGYIELPLPEEFALSDNSLIFAFTKLANALLFANLP